MKGERSIEIFAHRGFSAKYPENTLSAFRAVAKLPVEGVEFDVHLTKDRQVVVIHDETIDRTSNGKGFVRNMTLNELRKYDYGSWFGKEFAGEVIPTLSEALEVFRYTFHRINIELKTDLFKYDGLEEIVIREVKKYGMEKRVIISSFDHEAVARVAKLAPEIENAALFVTVIVDLNAYQKKLPAKASHVYFSTAFRKPVQNAIQQGAIIRVWTVNETKQIDQLMQTGVNAILTDDPEKMYQYIRSKSMTKRSYPFK